MECESDADGLILMDEYGPSGESRGSQVTAINKDDSESDNDGFVYDEDGIASFDRDN